MIQMKSWKLSIMIWVSTFCSAVASFSWIMDQSILTHDLTSYIAPIEAYLRAGVMPYLDYFDIKPPGMYLFTWVWIGLGANSMFSYLSWHFVFLLLYFYLQLNLVKKFFDKKYFVIVLILFPVLSLSTSFVSMILAVELVGSVLILLALNVLASRNSQGLNLWFAQVIFVAAGMTKEVYLFSMLLILFQANSFRTFLQRLKILLTVLILMYGLVICFLYFNKSLNSYLEVLWIKSDLFSTSFYEYLYSFFRMGASLAFHWYGPVFLVLIIFLAIRLFSTKSYSVRPAAQILISSDIRTYLILFLLIFLGFVWQGKPLSGHYAIALFPFAHILVLKTVSLFRVNSKMKVVLIISSFALVFSDFPIGQATQFRQIRHLDSYMGNLENDPILRNYRITEPGCLTIAYGWNPGAYLHYSKKYSCSKYFLPELSVQSSELRARYVNSIISNPPELIVYNPDQADWPVKLVEGEIFPWRRVLEHCYSHSLVTPDLYVLRFPSLLTLEICLKGPIRTSIAN